MISAVTGGNTNVTGKQHGDGCRGTKAGQDADRSAKENADETVKQVGGSSGRLQPQQKMTQQFHSYCPS